MYYFAYGSNMLRARLAHRVGAISVVGAGTVSAHEMRFHKRSGDGSGKCNLYFTGSGTDQAHGVVYALRLEQRARLDKFEGRSYRAQTVVVRVGRERLRALTYVALSEYLHDDLQPFDWYHAFVIAGARQHGLDANYVEAIARVTPLRDHDPERAADNTRLLRRAAVTI